MAHEHHHDHHHDHDHNHNHSHAPASGLSEYYLEQLLSVLVCGAIGVIGVLMYTTGRLNLLLAVEFHLWVVLGSIALLFLTVVRMVTLWAKTSESGHVHGPDCNHGHDHADHTHGGGGTVYLKVIPFALPVLLYVMGLPNQSFSAEWVAKRLGTADNIGNVADIEEKSGDVIGFDFNELNAATYDPDKRAQFEGRRIRIKGQLKQVDEKDYQLFKLKMTCCAADVIPLKARIRSDIVIPASRFPDNSWANVEGVLQFVELPEKRQYLPVIRIGGKDGLGLSPTTPE